MAVYYVPALQPIEFARFRALGNGRFVETFDEWALVHAERRRALVADGHHVTGVYVSPAEFDNYCRSANCTPDLAAMDVLATRIGTRLYETGPSYNRARAQTVVVEEVRSNGATTVVEETPARRHWWQFWRPRPAVVVTTAYSRPVRRSWGWPRWLRFGRRRPLPAE